MSSKKATFIGGIIAILLFIEVVGGLIEANREEEKNNPLDSKGRIKDGYTVSFEMEEGLALDSFPEMSEEEYNDQLLYTFSQCILTAESLNSFECLGNNVGDSYFEMSDPNLTPNEKGKIVYDHLVKNLTPTAAFTNPIEGNRTYELVITCLESKDSLSYILQIQDRKIISIVEREE